MAKSTKAGYPAVVHSGCADAAMLKGMQDTQCHGEFSSLIGTADPIPFPGCVAITSSVVNALTLAAPLPGVQPMGDDGKTLFVVSINAQAHVITCPSGALLGGKHLATFAAAVGNQIVLIAYNGVWIPVGTPVGVTLS